RRVLFRSYLTFTLVADQIIIDETEETMSKYTGFMDSLYINAKQDQEATHAQAYLDMVMSLSSVDDVKERTGKLFSDQVMQEKLTWLSRSLEQYGTCKYMVFMIFALFEG